MGRTIADKRLRTGEAGVKNRPRFTVQISSELLDAVQVRADEEAIPVAVFVRRAVTRLVNEAVETGVLLRHEVARFGEARRQGKRGPMRQWPKAVSYVVDAHIAERLRDLADEHGVDVSALAREAIARDLDTPSAVGRALPRDELGFSTSGAPQRGRATQQIIDAAWRSTHE